MTSTTQIPPTGQQPGQAPGAGQQGQVPGLPPTGLQQQLASMQQQYAAYQSARAPGLGAIGVDVNANAASNQNSLRGGATGQQQQGQQAMQATASPQLPGGQTSLQQLAQRLAQSYGLAVGRDALFDAQGNPNMTPDQLAAASGGKDTMGTAAAKMNYIAAAIQNQKNETNLKKSESALQAGLGLTSQRRSGSMIGQQQQFYSQLASLYQSQDKEAADFSYFIQKEKQDIENEMLRKAQKLAGKKARTGFWTGVALTAFGVASGNYWMAAQGAGQAYGSSGETGYF